MTTEKMIKRKKEKENLKFSTAFCAGCMFRQLDLSFEPPIISAADFFFYAYSNLISGLFLPCEEELCEAASIILFFRFLWIPIVF